MVGRKEGREGRMEGMKDERRERVGDKWLSQQDLRAPGKDRPLNLDWAGRGGSGRACGRGSGGSGRGVGAGGTSGI